MGELSRVVWIGGPAAAGKTTVSRLLARRHGLRWYCMDSHTWQIHDRAAAAGVELPSEGPGEFDRGPMVRADLATLPWPLVVVEGALVRPELVTSMDRALWLMPSRDAQRARVEERSPGGVHDGLLWGWQLIRGQLDAAPGAAELVVDGQTVHETIAAVEEHFADALAAGPTARDVRERQGLLRYANEITLRHSLTGIARGFVSGDGDSVIRTFDCECGEPNCEAMVDLSVRDAEIALTGSVPAVMAAGHVGARG